MVSSNSTIAKLVLFYAVTIYFAACAHASKIRHVNEVVGKTPSGIRGELIRDSQKIPDLSGGAKLMRSAGQRHLQTDTDEGATATDGEEETTVVDDAQDAGNSTSSLDDTLDKIKDEITEVANTPMEDWTTGQKAGVAVGALIGFIILLCLVKCICC